MLLTLFLITVILLAIAGWYSRTGTSPTPIPRSLVGMVCRARSGPWLLTLWRALLLIVVLVAAAFLAAAGGVVAGIIAFILMG